MERRGFNIGDFYNKKYFESLGFDHLLEKEKSTKHGKTNDADKNNLERSNRKLLSSDLPLVISNPLEGKDKRYYSFRLKVLYPGLVTGVGLNHEVSLEGEFKLGMHFDYTTGLPVIYGSSVKGVLKSYFIDYCKKEDADTNKLLDAVFEGVSMVDQEALPMFKRDVFFDAVIVKGNKEGKILCADSITPHDENPLNNPIPLTFMKIASGCEIEFRFLLNETKIGENDVFTPEQKVELFKQILLEVGIGAKTNVGYGQFEETKA